MTTRTTKKTVTFTKPFTLTNVDEMLPAGAYSVETDEEPLEGISYIAYRRVVTLLHVPGKSGSPVLEKVMTIDPTELDAALERDSASACAPGSRNVHQVTPNSARIPDQKKADRRAIERGENEGMIGHLG